MTTQAAAPVLDITKASPVAQTLIAARKILSDPRRWTKGRFRGRNADGEACYCALGAIGAVTTGFDSPFDECADSAVMGGEDFDAAADVLRDQLSSNLWGIPRFNDDPATTYEDVMKLFSDAIQFEVAEVQS